MANVGLRLAFLGCTLPMVLPVGAASTGNSQLLAVEHAWMNAAQHRDTAILQRILADDYVDISWRGKIRRKEDALRAPALSSHLTQKLDGLQVRSWGDTAVITGEGKLVGAGNIQHAAWRFTDVFVKRGDAWQAVSSQETPER